MKQSDGETVQAFIGRLRVTMHRLPQMPSDGMRIIWTRKAILLDLVRIAKINPTLDAEKYEQRLITQGGVEKMLADSHLAKRTQVEPKKTRWNMEKI